ncbi:MAG: ribonuclease P protein component [Flavobacterium stagni]
MLESTRSFRYPKQEKLKRRKLIERLFTEGESVGQYPLRLVFLPVPEEQEALQIAVSVSKKYFKKAVDRNYYKRMLRECYRLHQYRIKDHLTQPYAMLFFYQTRDRMDFATIERKTQQLFDKWVTSQTLKNAENDVQKP